MWQSSSGQLVNGQLESSWILAYQVKVIMWKLLAQTIQKKKHYALKPLRFRIGGFFSNIFVFTPALERNHQTSFPFIGCSSPRGGVRLRSLLRGGERKGGGLRSPFWKSKSGDVRWGEEGLRMAWWFLKHPNHTQKKTHTHKNKWIRVWQLRIPTNYVEIPMRLESPIGTSLPIGDLWKQNCQATSSRESSNMESRFNTRWCTLPETNIAPENTPLEKEIPIGNLHF